jgi:metal-sulfur cluster biosynthetic enzyme
LTRSSEEQEQEWDENVQDPLDALEIFQLIRNINDPEHPHTLEQLNVVQPSLIQMQDNVLTVRFTPTIPHCSMATLIGLCIRVRLLRSLPKKIKVDIRVTEGTHQSELAGELLLLIELLKRLLIKYVCIS